tara:strand:+ start:3809 stop:4210 length:402 start_codon:yes stop_codon:yes gene_type:complete
MRRLTIALCFAGVTLSAAPSESFWKALHWEETRGRTGAIYGDGGRSFGPLQISRAYWQDSRVKGKWADCASLAYSRRVVAAYMQRYAPVAWSTGDYQKLARIHNGGPTGHRKRATVAYWHRVRALIQRYERNN